VADAPGLERARAVVVDELSKASRIDLTPLPDSTLLRDEVPVDSLAMLQVFLRIEARLGIEIDEDALSSVRTLGDLVACVASKSEESGR
jgi:acyl carrier protein